MSEQDKKEENKITIDDRLIDGYNNMLQRIRQLVEKAEEQARPKIEEMFEVTRNKAIELNELTRDEAQKISEYVRRDLNQAAEFLAKTEKDLAEWFSFDMQMIESWLLESFKIVADQTKLELLFFQDNLEREPQQFKTGEITGPGSLTCSACGKVMNFKKTAHIPPCSACHKTEFLR